MNQMVEKKNYTWDNFRKHAEEKKNTALKPNGGDKNRNLLIKL